MRSSRILCTLILISIGVFVTMSICFNFFGKDLKQSTADDSNLFSLLNSNNSVHRFKVIDHQGRNQYLKYGEVINLLRTDIKFVDDFVRSLQSNMINLQLTEIFWECRPIRGTNMDELDFEFVLIDAPALKSIEADTTPFSSHFRHERSTVHFSSLGKDATLVVPCPEKSTIIQAYAHLGSFLLHDSIPQSKRIDLFQNLGDVFYNLIQRNDDQVVWLSTSGLGVSWLHIRLDSRPKYYNWQQFKDPNY